MADRMPPAWAERLLDNMLGPVGEESLLTCRLVTGTPPKTDPAAEELRILAADLLELHEAGALAGIRAVVSERLRQVRGEPAEGIDGRAYQAAVLAGEIDREAAR
jgi:hypothetical protein